MQNFFCNLGVKKVTCIKTDQILILVTDDLSYDKVATQSRTYAGSSNYAARFAVDRITLTCMRAQEIGLSSPEKTVWWKVDLGGVYSIYSIAILFKNYEGVGMLFFYINKIIIANSI